MKLRPRTLLIAVLAVIGAGVLIAANTHRPATTPTVANKSAAVELAPEDIVRVTQGDVTHTLAITGTLQAEQQTTITAQVEGQVSSVDVRPGQHVRRGQVLARLDANDLQRQFAVAQAQLAKSRDLLAYNRKLSERNQDLLKQNFISKNAFDTTQNQLQSAIADTRAAEAQLGLAQQALAKAVIAAPFDGMVADRFVDPGQHVGINGKLLTVVDLGSLELVANVPARRIGEIAPDQQVRFTIDGFPDRFSGHIARINPSVSETSKAVPVYIRIDQQHEALRSGLFAQGLIEIATHARVANLPLPAVRDENGEQYVLAIESGKLVRKVVTTGARDEARARIEITGGIKPGAIVLASNVSLSAGTQVKLPAAQPSR
ncbi:efflux RND transporter periplasmic adaptor subunit [Jeongeupia naejangsanensis]|uniref:Efflux RND transporter periplasmic adaptor subunit n=1 Tax=Jeongeupia naejangsanensis TaxID=613195 RepID=A0ABS2BIX7_9NEIS|nr:efflux RND transporter periplasmic adaptor subunit [Jeongeupia naejangsanensis]MBM3115560.1 efflux RND transporter periplasmic adaptor subunit [Jeongeupia naejangsanensis]